VHIFFFEEPTVIVMDGMGVIAKISLPWVSEALMISIFRHCETEVSLFEMLPQKRHRGSSMSAQQAGYERVYV